MEGQLGSKVKWSAKFEGGQLVLEGDFTEGKSSAGLIIKIDENEIMGALKAKGGIVGEIASVVDAVVDAVTPDAAAPAPTA